MSRVGIAVPLAALALGLLGVVGCTPDDPSHEGAALTPPESRAVLLLRAWDSRRAEAYRTGSVARLRRLYLAGSAAGRADVRSLRQYAARGLVVTGMRMQVLAVSVLHADEDALRLRVTDRLVGAVARGHGVSWALPLDTPTVHLITMARADGHWRMVSVRDVG